MSADHWDLGVYTYVSGTIGEFSAINTSPTNIYRLCHVFYCKILIMESTLLLMVQPAELLQTLGMFGMHNKYTFKRILGQIIFFLLCINITNLEPDIRFTEW
jgi:hypothetical protein